MGKKQALISFLLIAASALLVLGEVGAALPAPPSDRAAFLPVVGRFGPRAAGPTLGPSPTPTAGESTPTSTLTRTPTVSPSGTPTPGVPATTRPATMGPSPTPTGALTAGPSPTLLPPPTGGSATATPLRDWTPRPTTLEVLNVSNTARAAPGDTVVYSVGLTNYTEEPVMLSLVDTFPPELELEQAWNANCGGPGLTYTTTHTVAAQVQVAPRSACQLVIAVVVSDPCECAVTSTVAWQAPAQGWAGQAVGDPPVFLTVAPLLTATPTPGGQP